MRGEGDIGSQEYVHGFLENVSHTAHLPVSDLFPVIKFLLALKSGVMNPGESLFRNTIFESI